MDTISKLRQQRDEIDRQLKLKELELRVANLVKKIQDVEITLDTVRKDCSKGFHVWIDTFDKSNKVCTHCHRLQTKECEHAFKITGLAFKELARCMLCDKCYEWCEICHKLKNYGERCSCEHDFDMGSGCCKKCNLFIHAPIEKRCFGTAKAV